VKQSGVIAEDSLATAGPSRILAIRSGSMSIENRGRIVELRTVESRRLALVEIGGTRKPVFLDMIPDAQIGDYVKINAGFATERIDSME
jgi:hydrogenase maturation factor